MRSLNLLFLSALGAGVCFAAQAEQVVQAAAASARRIAELEERVERLESLVQTLLAEKQQSLEPLSEPKHPAETDQPLASEDEKPSRPQELLPALGKIGATASFTTGITSGAYGQSTGWFSGGGVELPYARRGSDACSTRSR